jgi:hypothetical protein
MHTKVVVLLAAMAISCGGVTPAARIETATAPAASPNHYRTFSLGLTEHPPLGYELTARSLDAQARLRELIIDALKAKGYDLQSDGSQADLTIRYATGNREVLKYAERHENPDTAFEGAIVVDAYDSATGLEIWHGMAAAPVNRDHIDNDVLQRGVREVLASFPARAPAGVVQ